jgi:outer membrane protein
MITRVIIVSALVVTSSCFVYGEEPGKPLHLKEAVDIAVHHNPLLKESEERVNQTEDLVPVSRAPLFPNISLSAGGAGKQDATANISKLYNGNIYSAFTSDAHLSQPLIQFGVISAIHSAKKDVDIQKLNAEISERDLTNQVIQGFYQVVLTSRNVDTLLREEKIIQESLKTTEKREQSGRAQLLDVLQIKTQLSLIAAQIIAAKDAVRSAAATLSNLLGDPKAKEVAVIGELDVPGLSIIDANVDLKRSRLPEVEQAKVSLAQIEDQKSVVLGPNLPSLNLSADYMWNSYQRPEYFSGNYSSWVAAVQLVIPIFSGLSSVYQRQALDSQQIQLEYNVANIENQTTLNQVTSRASLEAAQASIVSGEEALKLATASLNEANRLYRIANIDLLQFLTVQQAYVQAQQTLDATKFNYIAALGNYYVSSGQSLGGLLDLLDKVKQ